MELYGILKGHLAREHEYVNDDGDLKKWVVIRKAENYDPVLLNLLLGEPSLKSHFFIVISGTLVFDAAKFTRFVEQKNYLKNGYTAFSNKVGLTIKGKYYKQQNEVALVWPFKDCVLEGGQSREEDKREEIFFNEMLAQDELTQLFEPKVFTAAERISENGSEKVEAFNRDSSGTITDNLVIKGNNLLSLHSLKSQFAGKVKLIYIDPPYNTGSDSFRYNDSFSHSTWLTFMKNRLEVAKDFLKPDGVIFVQCDHHEMGYLNVLLDEVFGIDNKIQQIAVKVASPSGFKAVNPGPVDVLENILFYAKDKKAVKFRRNYVVTGYHKNYNYFLNNTDPDPSNWKLISLKQKVLEINGFRNEKDFKTKNGENYSIALGQLIEEFAFKHADQVVSIRDLHKPTVQVKELQEQSRRTRDTFFIYDKQDGDKTYLINGGALAFYSSKIKEIDGKMQVTELLTNFWNHISWAGIANEGGVKLKNGKKPEKLLKQILEIHTDEGDIVMDYHLGSGTTAAVAHKMKRQYIGLEQLSYGENDSVQRLRNVIAGDPTGISSVVKWKGGGSFVNMELKKYNEEFIIRIKEASGPKELLGIWEQMKDRSFLNYNIDLKRHEEHLEDFTALTLQEQKMHLVSLLDKNQLYVNLSSLHDIDFDCTVGEKTVTTNFYRLNPLK